MTPEEKQAPEIQPALLPCPFCGDGQPCLSQKTEPLAFLVRCLRCLVSTSGFRTKQEAIAAWNRRDSDQKQRMIDAIDRWVDDGTCDTKNGYQMALRFRDLVEEVWPE